MNCKNTPFDVAAQVIGCRPDEVAGLCHQHGIPIGISFDGQDAIDYLQADQLRKLYVNTGSASFDVPLAAAAKQLDLTQREVEKLCAQGFIKSKPGADGSLVLSQADINDVVSQGPGGANHNPITVLDF